MKILDCTLRDGGYYTNWNFTSDLVDQYLKTVSKLPISIIEIGYLSDKNDLNGPFYHLSKSVLLNCIKNLKSNQKIYVMINAKEIKDSKHLINLIEKKKDYIDGVRFAISPYEIDKFLVKIRAARKKFKKISFNINLMYLNKWFHDINFSNKVFSILKGDIDSVAFVDSYGSLFPDQISSFLNKLKTNKIKLGCHFHNNCGLALANTLTAINGGCEIADTTFRGMGRGAGNAETEMLIAIKTKIQPKISSFDISNLIEKFDAMKLRMKWGGSYAYAYAARAGYSQNEMMDLIQKRRLDPGIAVNAISATKQNLKRIKFTNIKNLKLKKSTSSIPILIGGAPSLKDFGNQLLKKINNKVPIILSGSNALFNFISLKIKIKNPLLLILSGSEINKIKDTNKRNFFKNLGISGIIIEKNFIPLKINFKPRGKIIISDSVAINPLMLAGSLLIKSGLKKMYLAFFDGQHNNEKGRIIMQETEDCLKRVLNAGLKVESLTKTFLPVKQINPWLND